MFELGAGGNFVNKIACVTYAESRGRSVIPAQAIANRVTNGSFKTCGAALLDGILKVAGPNSASVVASAFAAPDVTPVRQAATNRGWTQVAAASAAKTVAT